MFRVQGCTAGLGTLSGGNCLTLTISRLDFFVFPMSLPLELNIRDCHTMSMVSIKKCIPLYFMVRVQRRILKKFQKYVGQILKKNIFTFDKY